MLHDVSFAPNMEKKAEFLFSEPLAFHRVCALPQRCAFLLFAVSVGGRGNAAQHHGSEQALPAQDPRISDHCPDARKGGSNRKGYRDGSRVVWKCSNFWGSRVQGKGVRRGIFELGRREGYDCDGLLLHLSTIRQGPRQTMSNFQTTPHLRKLS